EEGLRRAHLRTQRQLAFGQAIVTVLFVFRLAQVRLRPAGAVRALVHLAARAEVAHARVLRSTERARVEAIAATNAQVLGMQHHAVGRRVEAVDGAHRGTRSIRAMHARHRYRALAGLAVVDGDDASAVDAPRHLVFVLAGGDARIALDAAVGVAEKLHSSHDRSSLSRPDLAQGGFGLLHARDRIEAVGGERVDALAQHDRRV